MRAFFQALVRFLGGIPFAIFLISCTALFVVAGTFFESSSGSHQYAATNTYENPLFIALLWGFFINILVSALRRWPFQQKHIPFLLTHFGLLMILGGSLAKSYYGMQGVMIISEGSASNRVIVPNTYALYIEQRDPRNINKVISATVPLQENIQFNGLKISLMQYSANCLDHTKIPSKYIAFDNGYGGYACPVLAAERSMKASYWMQAILIKIHNLMNGGKSAFSALSETDFPLIGFVQKGTDEEVIHQVAEQLISIEKQLPDIPEGIKWNLGDQAYYPLKSTYEVVPSTINLEKNRPLIKLRFEKENFVEHLDLAYERLGKGLRWPILGGQYVVRFQPLCMTLPHRLRVRRARVVKFPNSDQIYSYECDLLVKGKEETEVTLSMNHIYETDDFYRFYLSNISENGLGVVQLVVNRDPGKYLLTYPGAVILGLGILLLWKRVCGKG